MEPELPVAPQLRDEPPAEQLALWAQRASDALIEYTEQLMAQVHHLHALLDVSQATVAKQAATIKNLSHRLAEAETQLVIDERRHEALEVTVRSLNERVDRLTAGTTTAEHRPPADTIDLRPVGRPAALPPPTAMHPRRSL